MTIFVLAAVPWHWWFAPIWLGVDGIALIVIAVSYYRSVLVPEHQLKLAQLEERRRGEVGSAEAERADQEGSRLDA